jgi:cytochrome c-type biogenesis protein CcmF
MMAIALSPMSKIADLKQPISFPGGIELNSLPWVMFLTGLCVFTVVANVWRMVELSNAKKIGWSPFVTHVGVAILMAGLIISRGFERHERTIVMENHPGRALNYEIRYAGMTSTTSDRDNKVKFEIGDPHNGGKAMYTATPGFYYHEGQDGHKDPMVWPHIQRFATHDVYISMQPPETQAGEPTNLKPGETKMFGGLAIKYLKMTREGEPGMPGTKFGALIEVNDQKKKKTLNPKMELGSGTGVVQIPAKVDDMMSVAMTGMNAADNSVMLQIQLSTPMYPIDIFNKPMTSLVWLGTGTMTFGGFLAAFYRRRVRKTVAERGKQTEPDSVPTARKGLVTT